MVSAVAAACGCAVTQPQDTPAWQKLEIDPVTGQGYYMYVPSTYRPEKPAPLIVTCHGSPPFDVADHHIREWKMLGEENGCIVLAPQLIGTDGILGNGPVSAMIHNENYILSLISMVGYRYNVDMANIMITGFSGGGFAVYWVGMRNPDVFSCLALRSCNFCEYNIDGWYPPELADGPVKQAILIYWGQNDPIAIKVQSESGVRYLQNRNFNVTPQIVPGIGHERRPEVAASFFRDNWRPPRPSQPVRR
jgi:poly(3-hydroxybutyrate) depolymerase